MKFSANKRNYMYIIWCEFQKENYMCFTHRLFFKYTSIIKPVRIYHRSIFMKFQAQKPINMNIILCEFDKKIRMGSTHRLFLNICQS